MWSIVPSASRPLAPRPYLIPSIYLTCLFGSLLPKSQTRDLSVTTTLIFLIAQLPRCTTGERTQDYLLPIQGSLVLLHWLDIFVWSSPSEFWRIKDKVKEDDKQTAWRRLGWHADLCTAMRGVGWNWKVKNVPNAADRSTSKWIFIRTETSKAVACYLLLDTCSYLVNASLYRSHNPSNLFSDTIPMQFLFTWIPALGSYYALNMQYSVAAALSVGVGLYTSQDWSPLMGQLRDVLTVRDLWGKFWHQMLRRKINLPFRLLGRIIPIRRGTLTSRYMQLYLAFFTSALIHHLGAWNITNSTATNNWRQITYFLLQPIAISVEDLVIYLGKQAGVKESWKTKILGRIWTFAWFTYSLRPMAAFHYDALIFEKPAMPSLIQTVLGPTKIFL